MAQVYAVVYSSEAGKCLVFQKKMMGYYFGLITDGTSATFLPKGKLLNGREKHCFPGGKLERENYVNEAVREFQEETGVGLPPSIGRHIPFSDDYCAVFFDVERALFDGIFERCQANIQAKEDALDELRRLGGPRGLEDVSQADALSILQGRRIAIIDDELALVKPVMLAELKADPGAFFPNDRVTGWFNAIARELPV